MNIEIAHYLPHQGNMCLLEKVETYDAENILCQTESHLDPQHPLRTAAGLASIHGVEYAAQAAALHIALSPPSSSTPLPKSGFLAALQDCQRYQDWLDQENTPLQIAGHRLFVDAARGAKYQFRIFTKTQVLLTGELLIIFDHSRGPA